MRLPHGFQVSHSSPLHSSSLLRTTYHLTAARHHRLLTSRGAVTIVFQGSRHFTVARPGPNVASSPTCQVRSTLCPVNLVVGRAPTTTFRLQHGATTTSQPVVYLDFFRFGRISVARSSSFSVRPSDLRTTVVVASSSPPFAQLLLLLRRKDKHCILVNVYRRCIQIQHEARGHLLSWYYNSTRRSCLCQSFNQS